MATNIIKQNVAKLAGTLFYDIATSKNVIKVSSDNAGVGILMFRCGGTSEPQIIAIRDGNGYKVLSGTSAVSISGNTIIITAPNTYCFGKLITSHACTISYEA